MKVLFAVNNEKISQLIVKEYQKEYKEIITSKNVYFFNAIQTELRKDNTYDRIVIGEDLEPYVNNDYDAIDKFIFERLDSISDEAANSKRNDIPIILICADRREKSEDMLVKLFSIGIYDAVLGDDRSIEKICKLIRKPRTKKEAKLYYRIDTEDVKYSPENENEVSEVEIQNILNHYKKLGKNEDKYVESFENIAEQYNEEQLKLIAQVLPINVKVVLETNSPTYQKVMTSSVKAYAKKQETSGLSMNFILDKSKPVGGNIVVPSAVNTNNVKKVETTIPKNDFDDIEVEIPEPIREEEPKRRGRPRKTPVQDETDKTVTPKRRGRPRKNPLPEETESTTQRNIEEPANLFGIANEIQNDDSKSENNILPGFDEISQENTNINNINQNYNRFENNNNNNFNNTINNSVISTQNHNLNENIQNLLTGNKKIVSFVGTSKNGTSFLVNNVAQLIASSGINTAILDTTQNKNSYYIYTQNEEQLRNIAAGSIRNLHSGIAEGIRAGNNLTVYTAIPDENVGLENYQEIIKTLLQNHDLVILDCDFNTNYGYFEESQEIYLVQSLDVLTIQPLTAFLRDLKTKNILDPQKLKIVINKNLKVRGLTDKAIIGGMSYYNEPSMSFMTELFNRDTINYCSIPFEEQVYSRYLEGLVNCKISLSGYSKVFMQCLYELKNMVYPLIGEKTPNKKQKNKVEQNYQPQKFSSGINDTLNQMKKNY